MKSEITVSVCMITYNHESHIERAINGILMQKCTFPVNIVIGEDCSTDHTRQICVDFAKEYNEIYLLPSDRNLGVLPNFLRTLKACEGKYIALCEGDDYWTDPLKLQKQIDFLEANSDYGLVHTDADYYHTETDRIERHINKKTYNYCRISNLENIYASILTGTYSIRTLTACFRKELLIKIIGDLEEIFLSGRLQMGDTPLWLELSRITRFKYIDESTGVYNILNESLTHSKSGEKIIDFYNSHFYLLDYYASKYPNQSFNKFETKQKLIRQLLFVSIKRKDEDFSKKLLLMLGSDAKFDSINRNLLNISSGNNKYLNSNLLILLIRVILRARKILSYYWQKSTTSLC
jgi:glycosyltransferase involved in cell wall biosynthesis